jgi:GNAT superfamily N-acetyltransferase
MGLYSAHTHVIRDTFEQQERGEGLMLLATTNDFPLAQAWLDFARRGSRLRPRMWAIRVFPPLQGIGIGTWLLSATERCAVEHGARAVEIGVERQNVAALRFYRRLGYHVSGAEVEEVPLELYGCKAIDQYLLTKVV